MKKYNFVESIPLLLAFSIFLFFKLAVPSCESGNRCSGYVTLVMAAMGALGSFVIYKWAQRDGSVLSYYTTWQKRRLFIGFALWLVLLLLVVIDMFVVKLKAT